MPKLVTYILTLILIFLIVGYTWNKQTINSYHLTKAIEFGDVNEINDISGITINEETGNFWLINNNPPIIFEMSPKGLELKRIPLENIGDSEDITWIKENRFAIVEEDNNRLLIFDINQDSKKLRIEDALHVWQAPHQFRSNKGLESVAYNKKTDSFICCSEKKPIICYEVKLRNNNLIGKEILNETHLSYEVGDISAAGFLKDQTAILSDDSKLLIFLTDETIQGKICFKSGYNGLKSEIKQPEGICFVDNQIVIASEPNLIYFFDRKENPE